MLLRPVAYTSRLYKRTDKPTYTVADAEPPMYAGSTIIFVR
jgi:hypothetical protein